VERAIAGDGAGCPGNTEVHVIVGTGGGSHWTLRPVAAGHNHDLPIWSTWITTDAEGTAYLVWWDGRHIYLNVSRDGGLHWSKSRRVERGPSRTSVMANITASGKGDVEVAWYGTARIGKPGDTEAMGVPGSSSAALWAVYLARSTDGGRTFHQRRVTGVVHRGAVCVSGHVCSSSGDHDLFDDFGTAISPTTGATAITYTSDQPEGDLRHDFVAYTTLAPSGPGRR
jgi:hypothetical protein